jgi:hypothetical protein
MIAARTGEIDFEDGLRITAHVLIGQLRRRLPVEKVSVCELPIKGWRKYELGEHTSDFGVFTVEAVTSSELRVEGVFLSHSHSFYESATKDDSERRAFHDGVIASDLLGQREFPLGHVFCRLDRESNRDWLVVIYNPFASVPLHQREEFRVLFAHEPIS